MTPCKQTLRAAILGGSEDLTRWLKLIVCVLRDLLCDCAEPQVELLALADDLKLSLSSTCKLAQAGKIRGQKVGKHWRFHRDEIDLWLRGRKGRD